MDIITNSRSVSLIPPLTPVYFDSCENSPGFLPVINPNENGLDISERAEKYFGKGSDSLNFTKYNINFVI